MDEKFEKALEDVDELIRLHPEDGFYYFVKGTVIFHSGTSLRDALSMFEYSLRLKPSLVENTMFMGYCRLCIGGYNEAIELLNGYVEQKGDDSTAYVMLALCFTVLKDRTKAQELLEKAVTLMPGLTAETVRQQLDEMVFNQKEMPPKVRGALASAASELMGIFGLVAKEVR